MDKPKDLMIAPLQEKAEVFYEGDSIIAKNITAMLKKKFPQLLFDCFPVNRDGRGNWRVSCYGLDRIDIDIFHSAVESVIKATKEAIYQQEQITRMGRAKVYYDDSLGIWIKRR